MGFNTDLAPLGRHGGFINSGVTQGTIGSVVELTAGVAGSPATLTFTDPYDSYWSGPLTPGPEYSSFSFTLDDNDYEYEPGAGDNFGLQQDFETLGWDFGQLSPGEFSVTSNDDSTGHTYSGTELDSWKYGGDGTVPYENTYFAIQAANMGDTFIDGVEPVNEVQQVPKPNANGGTWAIGNGGPSTIPWNATVAELNTLLTASSMPVIASGTNGGPWTLTWDEPGPQALLTLDGSGLTKS